MATENYNLQELLYGIAKENGYEHGQIDVKDISSGGANYTSTLHVATISAPPKDDLKVFAKVANIGEELRATDETYSKIYETEKVFYSKLVVGFEQLYKKHNVAVENRMHVAKYYGHQSTDNAEIIVLENLSERGYKSFDRFKTFDWDYAEAAVKELTKFHALGIKAKEENIEEYEEMRNIGMDMFRLPMKDRFAQNGYEIGGQMIKEEYRSRVKKFLDQRDLLNDLTFLWKTVDDGFLIHSDYRPSNLMHRNKNGIIEVVPLDFQTLHFGTLVVDLLYLIWLGSDSKFRENHYQQILELYYSELTTALRSLDIDIDDVYPRKRFEGDLDECKTLGLSLALMFMPILTVDPEDAPTMDSEDAIAIKPNQLALEKVNEIVEEYIKLGII